MKYEMIDMSNIVMFVLCSYTISLFQHEQEWLWVNCHLGLIKFSEPEFEWFQAQREVSKPVAWPYLPIQGVISIEVFCSFHLAVLKSTIYSVKLGRKKNWEKHEKAAHAPVWLTAVVSITVEDLLQEVVATWIIYRMRFSCCARLPS